MLVEINTEKLDTLVENCSKEWRHILLTPDGKDSGWSVGYEPDEVDGVLRRRWVISKTEPQDELARPR